MPRPRYETAEDRRRERGVFDAIASAYNCQYQLAEDLAPFDGALHDSDGDVKALVEIKTRTNAHDKYPTYMLSATKCRNLFGIAQSYGVPALLLVCFTDGVYATKLKAEYSTGVGGRYDRNDAYDVEQCVYIPIEQFKIVIEG